MYIKSRPDSCLRAIALLALAMTTGTLLAADQTPGNSKLVSAPDSTALSAVAQASAQPTDREIDRQHLQRIYGAIQAYYKNHQDLPNWLSDLVPRYLGDTNDLISPIEIRTGKSVLYGRDDPKIHTSYIYEFNAGAAAEEFNRGREKPLTCKEWKLMQLGKFGLVTPILRCHLEKPVLNVAYSGEIYETGLLWEDDPNTAALVKANPNLGAPRTPPSGPRVVVRVVDANSGAPIPSAKIRSAPGTEFGLLPPRDLAADANGSATVYLGEWKLNFLFLTASDPSYQTSGIEWNRQKSQQESPPEELTIGLHRNPP